MQPVLKLLRNKLRNKAAPIFLFLCFLVITLFLYHIFNPSHDSHHFCANCTSVKSDTRSKKSVRPTPFSKSSENDRGLVVVQQYSSFIQPPGPCRLDGLPEGRTAADGRWYNFSRPPFLFYAYSAFIDNRVTLLSTHPVVRVIGVTNGLNITGYDSFTDGERLSCVLYYDGENVEPKVDIVKADIHPWKIGAGWPLDEVEVMEFIITCPLNSNHLWPRAVAVAETNGSAPENCMPVEIPKSSNPLEEYIICVPVTFGDLDPWLLVQWLEMQRILGVAKVVIYDYDISATGLEVLQYYAKQSFVELRQTNRYSQLDSSHYWLHNSPVFNDCMYRNMLKYKYVIVLDIDEIILPAKHSNLSQLVSYLESVESMTVRFGIPPSSFLFRNAYYFMDIVFDVSARITYKRHRRVNVSPYGYASKSITNMQACVAMHNHFCWSNTPDHSGPKRVEMAVDVEVATSRHYKKCHFEAAECASYFGSSTVNNDFLKFADVLEGRALPAYNEIFNVSST